MCPPAPVPRAADIGLYWTDEELCMSLVKIIDGSPLPSNVIADVNPYHYEPSNLPDGIWYLICPEEKKDMEYGFWKAKGEACEIFTNSTITGWRTTLEFYEGQAPHGRRTDWVIQEYRITQKGLWDNSKPKDSRSLCRVFLIDGRSPNKKMQPKHSGAGITGGNHVHLMPSTVPKACSSSGQGSTSESREKNGNDETRPLVVERLPAHPVEILPEFDYSSGGDYLELDDLADPESPSSSSDNSSCLTLTSDECFDSLALLRDIEDENQDQQGRDANFQFSVSTSIKPNEVVVPPANIGSLISGNGSKSPAEGNLKSDYPLPGSVIKGKFVDKRVQGHATRNQKAVHINEGTSSRTKGVSGGEKKAAVGRKKKLKKCLCFMPF